MSTDEVVYPLDTHEAVDLVADATFARQPLWPRSEAANGVYFGPDVKGRPAVVAIGAFDGFHLGHRSLIEGALRDARAHGWMCVAITFNPDPSRVVFPGGEELQLLAVDDRIRALATCGIDGVVALSFTMELARLTPEEFIDEALMPYVDVRVVHVGENFHFGYKAAGDVALLRALGGARGFEVCSYPLVQREVAPVSSTRIRQLLSEPGRIDDARRLLGRCHFVRGTIEHGRGEGKGFGFPTANVRCDEGSCMPAMGVYAGYVLMGNSAWPAAINVGAPVSFGLIEERFLEANLVGFEGDLYGMRATVIFVSWLRPARKFDSLDELVSVVNSNIDWVRENLGAGGIEVLA